jgi:hypothetical protein
MKLQKSIVRIAALLLFALPVLMSAQKHAASVQPTTGDRVANLKALLSLTDDQTTKVQEILNQSDVKARATEAKGKNRKAAVKETRIREREIDSQIEALLTPAQLQKYSTFKKARHDRPGTWRKGKGSEYNF